MSAIVLGGSYRSTQGRKPSRPSFGFYFHNDTAGGIGVADRFGNAAALTLQGAAPGAQWSNRRGFLSLNGTDNQLITGSASEYAAQSVMADALLTPGKALIVAFCYGHGGAKPTTNETFLCLGRSTTTSPALLLGVNATNALLNSQTRGVTSSALQGFTYGSAGDYSATADISALFYIVATPTGLDIVAYKDGSVIGTLRSHSWNDSGGSVPALANFAMPDGITIGATRGGSSGSPGFTQRMGATTSGASRLGYVAAINLDAPDIATAEALAIEMHAYPRFIGEILKGL